MKVYNTVINLVFLSGAALLLIFTVLSGSTKHFPLDRFFWLKADTLAIRGAPNQSAWTFWGVCESRDYGSCSLGPAYPISPVDNFSTTTNVPSKFVTSRDTFYYLTRFSFAFTFVGLAFVGLALILEIFGLCFESVDKLVVAFVTMALFFVAGTAALQTAGAVLARNAFHDANLSASLGLKSFAILWAAVAILLIVFFNSCFAKIASSYRKHIAHVRAAQGEDEYLPPNGPPADGLPANDQSSFTRTVPVEPKPEDETSGGIRFFRIHRNNKVSDEESL